MPSRRPRPGRRANPFIFSSFLTLSRSPRQLTPALPLVLAAAVASGGPEPEFVNAVLLLTGLVFLLFGLTGLGKLFLRLVPRVLRATIILGAGLSAIYGEFIPRSGGRPARLDAFTVSILVAVGLSLLLMFSKPLEPWKARYPWLRVVSSLGIAPAFYGAFVGWLLKSCASTEFAAYSGPSCFGRISPASLPTSASSGSICRASPPSLTPCPWR
jgi:hypothetical protein